MARFVDNFKRDDGTLDESNGWEVVGETSGGVTMVSSNAVALHATAEAMAFQQTTAPNTGIQSVEAAIFAGASVTEAADAFVAVFMFGEEADTATSCDSGYSLRLIYAASSVRTLELRHQTTAGYSGGTGVWTTLATAPVTTSTVSVGGTDLGVLQEIRLTAEPTKGGLRLRGYYNEDDASKPDIDYTTTQDFPDSKADNASSLGHWGFHLGQGAAAAQLLGVAYFKGEDWGATTPEETAPKDQLTRSEVRTQVTRRYTGSNTNVLEALHNELINDTVDDILQELGHNASWMQPTIEGFTVTRDGDGFAIMPAFMDIITNIWYTNQKRDLRWELAGRTADGALRIHIPTTETTSAVCRVTYQVNWERLDADTDRLPIPRKYSEVVYLGVMYRIASDRDNKSQRAAGLEKRYYRGIARIRQHEKQHHIGKQRFMVARRRANPIGVLLPYSTSGI